MRSFGKGRRFAPAIGIGALACLAGLASAAQVSLNLTRIHLGASHPVETVVLGNQEGEPLELEVKVQRWRQADDGSWQYAPGDGLVVHPLILRVPANGEARVRIGSLSPTVKAEEAYRVEFQQLPDRKQAQAGVVRMLTRINVPVFVQPEGAKPALALDVAALDADGVQLQFRNTGTGYAPPSDAKLEIRDAQGKLVHAGTMTLGYVLAGAQWRKQEKLPAGACAKAAKVSVRVGDAAPMLADIPAGLRRCQR